MTRAILYYLSINRAKTALLILFASCLSMAIYLVFIAFKLYVQLFHR